MLGDGLALFYPNGEPFNDSDTILEERDRVKQERDRVAEERDRVKQERDRVAEERDRVKQERDRNAQERDRAFARLRELGIDPSDL